MANTIRQNARTVTITFGAEDDVWDACITTSRPAKGADATRWQTVKVSDLGTWLEAYVACLSATSEA